MTASWHKQSLSCSQDGQDGCAHRQLGLSRNKGVSGENLHGVPVAGQRGDVADGQEAAGLLLRRQLQLHRHHHLRRLLRLLLRPTGGPRGRAGGSWI